MRKDQIKRPRHMPEIKGLDKQARVSDLPAAATAHEAPQLFLSTPSLPRRLLLEGAERSKLSLSVNDAFHGVGTEGADQLVLQVCNAHEEAQRFHVDASEVGAQPSPFETALEVGLLCGVTETRQPDVQPPRAELIQEASDGLRTPDRHNGDAFSVEIPTTAQSEPFEGSLVADSFNEHDRTQYRACRLLVHSRHLHSSYSATLQ